MSDEPMDGNASEESSGGAPGWIVTFADMMSLLLCFFVLLLSFSSTDAAKFKAAAESLKEAFNFTAALIPGPAKNLGSAASKTAIPQAQLRPSATTPSAAGEALQARLEAAKYEMDGYIKDAGLDEYVQTKVFSNYLKIVNSNPLNFPAGKAEMLESSTQYLDAMLPILNKFDFDIIVEGHTDNRPIKSALFRSNWELSAARAATFVIYLEEHGIDPSRLAVHGYGPYREIASNDTEEGRAKNRRIEILLHQPDSQPFDEQAIDSERASEGTLGMNESP